MWLQVYVRLLTTHAHLRALHSHAAHKIGASKHRIAGPTKRCCTAVQFLRDVVRRLIRVTTAVVAGMCNQ